MAEQRERDLTIACDTCSDQGMYGCINGHVYGPCTSDRCGGLCEYVGICDCQCHVEKA